MDITINVTDGVPIYRQIVNQVKYLAASGLIKPGEELPPIRTLALRERRRVIEQRIDALLAEAHQLNFTGEDLIRMVRERRAEMDETSAEAAEDKKEANR